MLFTAQPEHRAARTFDKTSCPSDCGGATSGSVIQGTATHGAPTGLSDNAFQLEALANLAASLCASVLLIPPSRMLTPNHNGGRSVPDFVRWDRYLEFRPAAGVANPLIDDKEWAAISSRHEDHEHDPECQGECQPLLNLMSTTPAQAAWDWGRAVDAVANGRRFVWHIDVNYWTWGGVVAAAIHSAGFAVPHIDFNEGLPPFDGCDHGQVRVSQNVLALVKTFEEKVGLSGFSDVSALHLRRGDMSTWCDTSAPTVIDYINCTDHEGVSGRQQLIIFTDETDPLYLSELFSGLKQLPQWGGRVVHGDPIIEKNAHHYNGAPDNYETYAAASNIISLAGQAFNVRCPFVCGERNADERGADRTDGNGVCHPCKKQKAWEERAWPDYQRGIEQEKAGQRGEG